MRPGSDHEPIHPAIADARELLELQDQYFELLRQEETARLARAVLLAPTLDICEALLNGETVPFSKLDPTYFRRYGIRRTA